MRRLSQCVITLVAAVALSSPSPSSAQGPPTEQRVDELLRGAYNPASSFEQLLDCHFRALTRGLELDSGQARKLREAIAQFRRRPAPPARSREWASRFALRDSSIAAVLRTRADSSRYAANAESEQRWFEAGNCNGPTVRRPD